MKFTTAVPSLLAASVLSGGVTAAPGFSPNDNKLLARQGGTVFGAECDSFFGRQIDRESFETTVRVYGENFGQGGELGAGEGFSWTYNAVCCSGWCFQINNRSGRTIGWSADDFWAAVDGIRNAWADGANHCIASVADDPYLAMQFTDGEATSIAGRRTVDVFGDTCGGAPAFHGQI